MTDAAPERGVLSLMRAYDPPPDDFDPSTATEQALRRHGLPRRPDPETEPHLARAWRRALARPTRFVKAELAVDPVMSARDPLRSSGTDFAPTGWAGVARTTAENHGDYTPFSWVFSQWTVPEVWPLDPAAITPLTVGFWVGLDGYNGVGEQVLQAGVAATVSPVLERSPYPNEETVTGYSVEYWAWTEWYTGVYQDPAVRVTNFPVSAGDTVSFLVCAWEPDQATVTINNLTTGQLTRVAIHARPGITSEGASAEWIVEGISDYLPDFNAIAFTSCSAGTSDAVYELTPGDFDLGMRGTQSGGFIAECFVLSPTLAVVEWLDYN